MLKSTREQGGRTPDVPSRRKTSAGDPAVAALYRLPPEEFTAARDDLARERKKAGDVEGAAAIKALRKPTVAAWALNSLSRSRADDVQRLLDVSEKVRDAQRRALSTGKGDALRAASAERTAAVRRLTSATMSLLAATGRPASATVEEAVSSTLQAVATNEDVARLLAAGRLAATAEAAGFGDVAALSIAPTSAGGERSARSARAQKSQEAEQRKRRLMELAAEAKHAEGDAQRQAAAAERLEAAAAKAQEAAALAVRHAEDARHAAERARGDADVAAKLAEAARRREQQARKADR